MAESLEEIAARIQDHLAYLRRLGVYGVDCSETALGRLEKWGKAPASSEAEAPEKRLAEVFSRIRGCRGCEWAGPEADPVCGAGNPRAWLMFVGGFPEPEDAEQGEPFRGGAGELLSRMIKAMSFSRDSVYISHALKCLPPAGGSPPYGSIEACSRFLREEIAAVSPLVVCTLGDTALQALLGEAGSLAELRGRFQRYREAFVMPTHSPGYLLAHPAAKREAWHDLQQIMAFLASRQKGGGRSGNLSRGNGK